ncbi:replicative DNA helicase [Stutzerimonas stutzeri]|uniref:replicative DNA helicase n=1 Tax=Stutzerimonas TaxID=2901164 RepID=UPI00052E47D5|nr:MULTISPECIES: replicative DNA helicase [Stutzerimonas]CEG51006.1 replicative DNA helicase [Stutzerimonas xanthomarina]MDH0214510.1 replicative DNA helicase [Stutzerimonas stutzeri]MDH0261845.1 replicative DNA helicase [Stutzerimonas stutzeri]MDI9729128.1 replicative DNA helicase [Stutzerimonas stutzeri]MDI9750316.1 replicative DNA helicase [Stutzerimonas stutzeri]
MSPIDLTPPHSVEAEQGVLGGLMLDNSTWDDIADTLAADDFYIREHRLIFKAIADLAKEGTPFDVVTLSEKSVDVQQEVGLAYLGELAMNTPSVANILAYAKIVRERSHLRNLVTLGYECSRQSSAPGAVATDVQESVERQLFALGQNRLTAFTDIGQMLSAVVDKIDHRFNSGEDITGVTTDLSDLDELLGGLQPKDLVIVAARPSMGKTAFALKLVNAALARTSKSAQVFSLEMPAEQLVFRFLAFLGRIDLSLLTRGRLQDDDWPKLTAAVAALHSYGDRLVIDDTPQLTPTELRARSRRAARKFGDPALIMVDYLQLMQSSGKENRNLEIADISASLKALAKEMDCPVVALSQLNRSLEQRANKRPLNADLRESGALEQDADVIMFIYRDEVYHPDSEDAGIAEIIIGKQRNGPLGTVRTAFLAAETRFENLDASYRSLGVSR